MVLGLFEIARITHSSHICLYLSKQAQYSPIVLEREIQFVYKVMSNRFVIPNFLPCFLRIFYLILIDVNIYINILAHLSLFI